MESGAAQEPGERPAPSGLGPDAPPPATLAGQIPPPEGRVGIGAPAFGRLAAPAGCAAREGRAAPRRSIVDLHARIG